MGISLLNIAKSLENVAAFIQTLAVILGIGFIMLGLFKLKHLADYRNQMSGQAEVGKAFIVMLCGVGLIWMPFLLKTVSNTIFNHATSAYKTNMNITSVAGLWGFFIIMRFIGILLFVKGWVQLANSGKGHSQPGTMGKAITHLITGILLYHLKATLAILENTLGLGNILQIITG